MSRGSLNQFHGALLYSLVERFDVTSVLSFVNEMVWSLSYAVF